ncbi:class I SAM-dependent methyltransferase [Yinghuangia seranimata]|uniref:class I SAM-dependent methyltransferase n=1 Tax=Yinghuangia seranimata TaxID=408067 RepID=UPI00248CE53C|nr:methyltransferase domain-containing protein [Yinghuangia seranimata]MDI2126008.1 methyltransferase domain-containing protein [Yinghuangia seranimata]
MSERIDTWAVGDAYDRYMGRWSRLVADAFVAWLDVGDGLRWLDVGCGTGALTSAVTVRCRPRTVVGLDRSAGFVAAARAADPGPAGFAVADGLSLPVRDGAFDVAVSGLALNFLPEPESALAEAARVVAPGGQVAAYVWDYSEGMGFLRHFWDAASLVDPSAAALDEGRRFPVCRPEPLRALWAGAGLVDVAVAPIDVPTVFPGFADLWEPFLTGQGPAPGYVSTLAPAARDRVRDALARAVPARPDGSIALTARAWGVRGRR